MKPLQNPLLSLVAGLALSVALGGCAGKKTHESQDPLASREASQNPDGSGGSQVEIAYTLGHSQHRFRAESQPAGPVTVTSYLERAIVDEGEVDQRRYSSFLRKALDFVKLPHRAPGDVSPCRSPFMVTVRIGKDSLKTKGCRSSDEGALSHLVHEGEFLLYSKK